MRLPGTRGSTRVPRGTIQPGTLALLKALHGTSVQLPPNHWQWQPLPRCSRRVKVGPVKSIRSFHFLSRFVELSILALRSWNQRKGGSGPQGCVKGKFPFPLF